MDTKINTSMPTIVQVQNNQDKLRIYYLQVSKDKTARVNVPQHGMEIGVPTVQT